MFSSLMYLENLEWNPVSIIVYHVGLFTTYSEELKNIIIAEIQQRQPQMLIEVLRECEVQHVNLL